MKLTPRTMHALAQAVVNKLAGQPVRLRWQVPATKGMTGECHRDETGQLVIDVSPGLKDNTTLYVLLHETAHARNDDYIPSTVNKAGAGTLAPSPNTVLYQLDEIDADNTARRWMEYAKAHADPSLGDLEGPLWVLLNDYKE